MDELLRPLCLSHDEQTYAALVEELLLEQAQPIIQRVLRSQLRADKEAEDISQEAMLRVWQRLHSLSKHNGIDDFGHWVARLTLNLCRDALRSRAPQRVRLKRQLRNLLRTDRAFRFEQNGSGEWLCGLAEWRELQWKQNGMASIEDFAASFSNSVVALDSHEPLSRETITDFLCGIGHSIELNELVSVIVEWQGIREERVSLPDDVAASDSTTFQFKVLLRQIWRIAHRLPLPQRRVLTLGELPEYETALANLWLMHKTTNASDLALWLDLPLASLQNLLPQLPISSAALGEQFALTREQITKARYRALQKLRTELNDFRAG